MQAAIGTIGGVAPAYARAAAAGDLARLAALRSASWALAGLIALAALPVIWSGTQILSAFGLPGPLLKEGQGYVRAMAVNIVPLLALAVLRNRATALERPGLLFRITLAALPLNAALNWVLMHGAGAWTGFGSTGLGLSSVVVTTLMVFCLAVPLRRAGDGGAGGSLDPGLVLRLGRAGLPIGISMLAGLGIFLGATVYAAGFGTEAVAAHALAIRLQPLPTRFRSASPMPAPCARPVGVWSRFAGRPWAWRFWSGSASRHSLQRSRRRCRGGFCRTPPS